MNKYMLLLFIMASGASFIITSDHLATALNTYKTLDKICIDFFIKTILKL